MSTPLRYICVACGNDLHLCDRCNLLIHDGKIVTGDHHYHLHPLCPAAGDAAPVELVGNLRA